MTNRNTLPFALSLLALAATATAQHGGAQQSDSPNQPMYVAKASDDARQHIRSMQVADGLVVDLIAAEPDLCNVVAFDIDDQGNFYVCETFRVRDGVFDNRNYMQWLDRDLAARTVQDRIAKYEEFLKPERIEALKSYSERIRMLADVDGNGTLDRSTVFADGFTALEDGLIAGVLRLPDGSVVSTNIPKVWRHRDTDGDGIADERSVLFDGFGVHTSLMGHDMHGLIVGPDKRLYFSIGDRGFHVEHEGETHAYPDEGAVLRCELDGSDLEVVHRGLRNPQELAFDQWGDLFTGDNNSDGGDKARLVQILPGADSGWRIGFQWLRDRGAWNREKMWHPRHPEQATGIVPPIQNFADGPSGLCYDPGTGLPERFRDCFFLCDFRGSAARSGIRTFRLARAGAGFEVRDHDRIVGNTLPTDCAFGPDGALYLLDWVHGWSKTGKGRIYRIRTPQMANDFKLRNGMRLLKDDLTKRPKAQLQQLLAHEDRRVRQKAQFALIDQGASDALEAAARSRESRVARLHGIWGLGVLLRTGGEAHQGTADVLASLLDDDDGDVRAMAARALGDARSERARGDLRKLLRDDNSRARREAALALARLPADAGTADDVLKMVRHNDDRDHVLRHAGAVALAAAAPDDGWLVRHRDDDSRAAQRVVLLALSRRGSPEVAHFLRHPDEQFRYDAARAIYETPIPDAMQALAQLTYDDQPDSERVDWRAINAARQLGSVEHAEALIHVASQQNHPNKTRLEALAVLGEWREPDGQCRVIGVWRPCAHADLDVVAQRFAAAATGLLADDATAAAAAAAIARLRAPGQDAALASLVADTNRPIPARVAALDALAASKSPSLQAALQQIPSDAPVPLRKRSVELLSRSAPEQAVPVLESLLANASISERQAACKALGDLDSPAADAVLTKWAKKMDSGEVPPAVHLDLLEALDQKKEGLAEIYTKVLGLDGELAEFGMCLDGGDVRAGRRVFFDNQASSCTRCHAMGNSGANAGPNLEGVGKRLQPKQLLEALITPSARIAEGFATTTLELTDGSVVAGVVTKDQDGSVTIVGLDGKPQSVTNDRIRSRKQSTESAMPVMATVLTKRQIRDLIAFLKSKK